MLSRPVPSRKAAALCGLLIGFGLPVLDIWQSAVGTPSHAKELLLMLALLFLFFLPALFFVFGLDHLGLGIKAMFSRAYWRSMREVAMRGVCWLTGAGLASALLSMFKL